MATLSFSNKAKAIVQASIEEQQLINVSMLATHLGIDSSQLYRKLKTEASMNPSKFIRTIRLTVASNYLVNSDESVQAIAFRVGFASSSYFIQCFKTHFGYTPKAYRYKHDN